MKQQLQPFSLSFGKFLFFFFNLNAWDLQHLVLSLEVWIIASLPNFVLNSAGELQLCGT